MSHTHALDDYQHSHVFLGEQHHRNERRTWLVVTLTAAMMVVEIAAGMLFGSMALLADGIHMATHAGALIGIDLAAALRACVDGRPWTGPTDLAPGPGRRLARGGGLPGVVLLTGPHEPAVG